MWFFCGGVFMRKRIIMLALVVFLLISGIYIACFTNIIFNHSCVGITYASTSETFGVDLILRYFDSERDAEKLYNAESIDTYYLVAINADNALGYNNTQEWFYGLKAPLVYDNVKYVSVSSMDSFAAENELMLYAKGNGLDDGYIDKSELDRTFELYDIGTEWMTISDNCTESEKDFYLKHCGLAFSLESAFDKYKISEKYNDTYSISFWSYQITDLCEWEAPAVPSTHRENIDWDELNNGFTRHLSILKEKAKIIGLNKTLDESDWSLIDSSTLAYTASIVSLNRDLNSDSIEPLENENDNTHPHSDQIILNSDEKIVFEGTIVQTHTSFPQYCLKLNQNLSITLKDGDLTETFVCDTLYFYQDAESNGGYDFDKLENATCSVTASLENYRGGGNLFLLNPIITTDEQNTNIQVSDATIKILSVRPCEDGMYNLTVDYKIENIQDVRGCVYLKCDAHAFTTQVFFNDENHRNDYREDGIFSYNVGWQNDGTTKSLNIRYGYGEFDPYTGWTKECSTKIYYRLIEDYGTISSTTIPQNEIFDIYNDEQYIGAWTINYNGDLIEIDGNSTKQPFSINNTYTSANGNTISVMHDGYYTFSINGETIGTVSDAIEMNDALLFEIDADNGTYLITRYPNDEYVSIGTLGFLDASLEGEYYP